MMCVLPRGSYFTAQPSVGAARQFACNYMILLIFLHTRTQPIRTADASR